MKKFLSISFGALAAIVLTVSCNQKVDPQTPSNDPGTPSAEKITITATLSDALTKVTFDPAYDSNSKPTGMAHTWQSGDKLRITNASSVSEEFELVSGEGTDTGVFSGNSIDGGPFTVEAVPVSNPGSTNATQTQAADGSTAHLLFVASATGVNDLSNIELTETSNIIGFVAKLPAGAAATINELEIEKSIDDFANSDKLNITIASQGDVDNDNILKVYANIPASWNIVANTKMFLRFKSTNTAHTVYTRYQEFTSAVTPQAGKFNYIKMNCSNIDKYAGGADAGSATAPYLIADPYQLLAMEGLLATEKRYFKLLCDIDMDGLSWTKLNPDPFTKVINLDGNSKKISNLNAALFDDLNGTVVNLTIEDASVSGGSSITGILANTIKTATSTVTNVDINKSSVTASSYTGGLIGEIDNTAANTSVTNCDVSNTNVNGTLAGGLIGFANGLVIVSGCTYTGGTVTATARFCGGLLASTGNYASVISDCHVEDATISVSIANNDYRTGGFVGQLQTSCTVKGCSVGTASKPVTITLSAPTSGKVYNAGGFVGVNYGTITKDGDTRNTAYVAISSGNTEGTAQLNVGGFVGYHTGTIEYSDAVVDMSNLQGQVIGGFVGTTPSNSTIIDHCTVDGNVKGNNYTGMFIGKVDKAATITNNTAKGTVSGQSSVGGFVGYCENNPTFTDNTTSATTQSNGANVGGFVGAIESATMTRCSATGKVEKLSSTNNDYGGFAGYTNNATLDSCYSKGTVDVDVAQTETVGGFIGQVMPATGNLTKIDNCYSESKVDGIGRWTGGFIGYIYKASDNCGDVEITKCHASGDVSVTGKNYVAGFIGRTYMVSGSHLYIDKCYATGNVSSTGSGASAFIGEIGEATICRITDCFCTGTITGNNQQRGGLVAIVNANANTSVTISRCYSSSEVNGSFRLGGLIGNINNANVTVEDCAAWNSGVIASSVGPGNWSSGAVVGTAFPTCTLTDNYRKPSMTVKAFWGNVSGTPGTDGYTWELTSDYNHPNVSSSSPLIICEKSASTFTLKPTTATALASGQDNYPIFPYHGMVEAGKTLSQLASTTLGWDSTVWDFTGDLPTLK